MSKAEFPVGIIELMTNTAYYYIDPKTLRPRRSLTIPEGIISVSTLPNPVHGYYRYVRSVRSDNKPIKSCLICRKSNFRVNRQPLTCKIGHTYLHDNIITDIAYKCQSYVR